MLIALFMLLHYLATTQNSEIENVDKTIKHLQELPQDIEKNKVKIEKKEFPFGVSIYGNYNDNVHGSSPIGDIYLDTQGLVLEYQVFHYLTIYGLLGYTNLDSKYAENSNLNFSDYGITLGLGSKFEHRYKNLYYGTNLFFLHTNMDESNNFNTSIITPRLGYINDSMTFRAWAGITYTYRNQDFIIDIKDNTFLPTLGVEYLLFPNLELMGEVYFKESYKGLTLKITYKF